MTEEEKKLGLDHFAMPNQSEKESRNVF